LPYFNEASRIYTSAEVTFLRSCFSEAAIIIEESDHNYSAQELATSVIMLYEHGLRNKAYLCELAARLAHQKFNVRHSMDVKSAELNAPRREHFLKFQCSLSRSVSSTLACPVRAWPCLCPPVEAGHLEGRILWLGGILFRFNCPA
jgi:hypothetical protein